MACTDVRSETEINYGKNWREHPYKDFKNTYGQHEIRIEERIKSQAPYLNTCKKTPITG